MENAETTERPHPFAYNLFTPEKAESVAEDLHADDPAWTYVAEHDLTGKGYSYIKIYDEHGYFVGRW